MSFPQPTNLEHRLTRIEETVRRLDAELLGNAHRRGLIPGLQFDFKELKQEVEKLKEFRYKSTGMIIAAVSILGFVFKLWR